MKSAVAWELGWALIAVLIVYVLASGARRTVAIGALLVMIPFQFIEHSGSLSPVATLLAGLLSQV